MIDFLRYRKLTAISSLLIIIFFVADSFYKIRTRGHAFTYSVDFTGGTQVLLKFDKSVSSLRVKEILEAKGWPGAITREFSPEEVLVRVKEFSYDSKGMGERIQQVLTEALSDVQISILQTEAVGEGVGADLRWKSIRAVLLALLAMLLYIATIFWSFAFAMGAVLALFHDAIIMLATFLLFDREISINVIGAILAVLGYSINDTIVIFDQIRDNIKKMKNASLNEVINVSLNQTMRRTLLTSVSTALTVGSMFVLGGEALRDFSLALLVGIIFGTYSSIYIASPVMKMLYKEK